jgi:hypothetical protein
MWIYREVIHNKADWQSLDLTHPLPEWS